MWRCWVSRCLRACVCRLCDIMLTTHVCTYDDKQCCAWDHQIIKMCIYFYCGSCMGPFLCNWFWLSLKLSGQLFKLTFSLLAAQIPESPRYLLERGHKVEALEALQRIARMNGIKLPPGELVTEEEKAILCGRMTPIPDKVGSISAKQKSRVFTFRPLKSSIGPIVESCAHLVKVSLVELSSSLASVKNIL